MVIRWYYMIKSRTKKNAKYDIEPQLIHINKRKPTLCFLDPMILTLKLWKNLNKTKDLFITRDEALLICSGR